jgi:hypothetical protein
VRTIKTIVLVIVGLCSALGGIGGFLQWLKIEPKDVHAMSAHISLPHWLWLIFGLILFAISFAASFYALYLNLSRAKTLQKELSSLKQSHVEEIGRLNTQHESEEFRSRQIRDTAIAEARTTKERITELETQLAGAKKHIVTPPEALPVELQPTKGPSDRQFLIVTNKGTRQRFHAQCIVLDHSASVVKTTFDLGWESGVKLISLEPEETRKLLIAKAWDDRDHHLDYMALCEPTAPDVWRNIETERWDSRYKPDVQYRLEIKIFGENTQACRSQQFIVRPGTGSALEMLPVLGADNADRSQHKSLFDPLQIEAFQLARELREWMKELGPRLPARTEDEDPEDYLKRQFALDGEWSTKFTFGYRNRFADRVVNLACRFAENGAPRDFTLEGARHVISEDQVADIARRLQLLAAQIDALAANQQPKP